MAYKILYIEDLDANSIKSDLNSFGFEVDTNNADEFTNVIEQFKNQYDAYLIDYELTANSGVVNAPTYAQTLRSRNDKLIHKDAPIIIISNDINKTKIYDDYTSQDLFDLSVTKEDFRKDLKKYTEIISAFINSYETINNSKYDLKQILNLTEDKVKEKIDYRFIEKFEIQKKIKDNAFGCCSLIYNSLIKSIGPLVGIDMLSARLGISKESTDWDRLLGILDVYKYSGVFSEVYERWWMDDILSWWNEISKNKSMRRTPAATRMELISEATKLELKSIEPVKFYNSSNYWSICSFSKNAIDPSEAYIIENLELLPWQENTYISHIALLDFPELQDKLTTIDRKDLREFQKTLIKGE